MHGLLFNKGVSLYGRFMEAGNQIARLTYPPTIVVRSPKENPRKCSILPLKGRADLVFLTHPARRRPDLSGYVRLAVVGEPLSQRDADRGLLVLDGSWNEADKMTKAYLDVPPRSLGGYATAYPRVSKLGRDPDGGLATVEALYLAYRIMGRPTAGILEHYRWGAEFLARNGFAESI